MIASGWLWTECSHRTSSSDFTPSMCALSYLTTPSSPVSTGPSPLTAMMEWASTPGSIGMTESVLTNGFRGDMLSTAVGKRFPPWAANASRFARSSAVPFTRRAGVLTSRWRRLLTKSRAARKLPRLLGAVELVDRRLERGIVEPAPRVHGHHLRQQAALAVADHDHLLEARILSLGIQQTHGVGEGVAQDHRRVGDRAAAVVRERPEVVVVPDGGIGLQDVDHLRPAARARGGAVDEDDRDLPEPGRGQRDQLVLRADLEHASEEPLQLPLPDRRLLEAPGQRRRRLLLERHRTPGNHDRLGLRLGIEVEGGPHPTALQLLAGVVDSQQRRGRDLDPRRDDVAHLLVLGDRNHPCRQRGADAGPPNSNLES